MHIMDGTMTTTRALKSKRMNPPNRIMNDQERIAQLEAAINEAVDRYGSISWGWDGDCGSERIIDDLEEVLNQTE